MTGKILDIEKWKTEYPFLSDVSNMYDEFDKNIDDDTKSYLYDILCGQIINKYGGEIIKHKDSCMKLVRNLGHHSNNNEFLSHTPERCNNLNNWIYYSMKKHKITEKIIIGCFDDYDIFMKGIDKDPRCSYYSYDHTYFEPMKMVELKYFHDNMHIIRDTFLQKYERNNVHLQKYICEYVDIYKKLNSTYCPYEVKITKKHIDTCNMLEKFKTTYMSYLYNDLDKKSVIPSLDDIETEYTKKCLPSKLEVPPSAPMDNTEGESPSLTVDLGEEKTEFSSPRPYNVEKPGSSMSRTVSTAVGTMAGASSIIALLYKFTPGRNWMRSGIRGNRGRISNILHAEQPNELFYDGYQGEYMSTYNARYNIGYGSA